MGMLVGGISVDIPPHQCKAGAQVWRRPVGRPPARRRLRRGGDPCGGTQTHDPALVPPAYNNTPNKAFLRRRAPDPPPGSGSLCRPKLRPLEGRGASLCRPNWLLCRKGCWLATTPNLLPSNLHSSTTNHVGRQERATGWLPAASCQAPPPGPL